MKRMLIGLAMLVGAEGAAHACSCIPNAYDPVAERETANRLAGRVVALIEVEVVEGYNSVTRQGEVMRVRHILHAMCVTGSAPGTISCSHSRSAKNLATCRSSQTRAIAQPFCSVARHSDRC